MLLREWRGLKGLSREELAVRAGTTYSTIANLELGRHEPRIGLAQKLADVLNVSLTKIRWEPDSEHLKIQKGAYVIALQHRPQEQEQVKADVIRLMREAHLPQDEIDDTLTYLEQLALRRDVTRK